MILYSLFSFTVRDEEWEAKSVMLAKNETFLVGAKKKDGVLKWDNGVLFNPLHDMFGNYTEGEFVIHIYFYHIV